MASGTNFKYGAKQMPPGRRPGKGNAFLYLFLAIAIVVCGVALLLWAGSPADDKADDSPDSNVTDSPDTPDQPDTSGTSDISTGGDTDLGGTDTTDTSDGISTGDPDMMQLCSLAESKLAKEDYPGASETAYKVIASGLSEDDAAWRKAADILSLANIKILTTDVPDPKRKKLYTVQKGDALAKIAKKYKTTVEAIQKGNNMSAQNYNIRIGQTLCVFEGDWSIKVDKSRRRLYLYDGKKLFKLYDVGIGKQNRTPVGKFKIVDKIKEPDWYSPKGKIPYGSKENVLGSRWMKLKPIDGTNANLSGYGIHGTADPDSIGKAESNGCIRMKNEQVEELFSIVPRNIEVIIEE